MFSFTVCMLESFGIWSWVCLAFIRCIVCVLDEGAWSGVRLFGGLSFIVFFGVFGTSGLHACLIIVSFFCCCCLREWIYASGVYHFSFIYDINGCSF